MFVTFHPGTVHSRRGGQGEFQGLSKSYRRAGDRSREGVSRWGFGSVWHTVDAQEMEIPGPALADR